MKKIILPSLLAALVILVWSSISWMMIGWHMIDIFKLPDETVVQQMDETITEPGIYVYPGYPEDQSEAGMKEWTDKHLAGPLFFMVYQPTGGDPMPAGMFVKGFVLNFITAFIAATLLFMTLAQNPSFRRRVIFVVLLGAFAGFMYPFSEWNWWQYPLGYTLVNFADGILTWFFAGLVLAWRIKP
jgi:hypothetical protein